MIGTTLKVGFDSSQVDRGLGGITGKLGRVGRQIGIGMARQVGSRMTDMLGRIVMAVPETLKETADWAGGLTDMATQTKLTVSELILLEEKLRLSGASARDTSKVISTMTDALYEAKIEAGPAREAINALGFLASDFDGKSPADAFDMIGKRVAELGPQFEGLETAMGDLFGARIGYGLLRFFNDIEANTAQAENNVRGIADAFSGDAAYDLDRFSDSLGRFETFKRSLSSIALDEIFKRVGGKDAGNTLFDSIDPEKFRPTIEKIGDMLERNIKMVMSGDFSVGDFFKNIGNHIGEGIKESFDFSPSGILKGLVGMGGSSSAPTTDPELVKQTELLERMLKKTGIAIAQ